MYTWNSIILNLISNKQGLREWIRFNVSGEAPVADCSQKIRGISWLLERLIGCQKSLRSMHLVIDMRYQTPICRNAARRRLAVGYRIVKRFISPIFQGSSNSPLAVPKRRYTNTSLRRTTKACPRHVGAPG